MWLLYCMQVFDQKKTRIYLHNCEWDKSLNSPHFPIHPPHESNVTTTLETSYSQFIFNTAKFKSYLLASQNQQQMWAKYSLPLTLLHPDTLNNAT